MIFTEGMTLDKYDDDDDLKYLKKPTKKNQNKNPGIKSRKF